MELRAPDQHGVGIHQDDPAFECRFITGELGGLV
jgi:hypothetical protein